jgi:hypothetical protein
MYVALVYLALGVPAVGMSIYLGFAYGLVGVAAVLGVNTLQLVFGNHLRGLEKKSRSLHCSPAFQPEYAAVGETWFKKALPNF